jgi:hypothetical protein
MADPIKLTIEITVGHCLGGAGNDVYPGERISAPGRTSVAEALAKVRMGYARVVQEGPSGPGAIMPGSGPGSVINGDPQIETRDPEIEGSASVTEKTCNGRARGAGGRNSK